MALTQAYRGLLRELSKSAPVRGTTTLKKSPAVQFRKMIEEHGQTREVQVRRAVDDATTYVRNHREYLELLKRYNPLHDMSSEEHLDATVRRVGLQMPADKDFSKPL